MGKQFNWDTFHKHNEAREKQMALHRGIEMEFKKAFPGCTTSDWFFYGANNWEAHTISVKDASGKKVVAVDITYNLDDGHYTVRLNEEETSPEGKAVIENYLTEQEQKKRKLLTHKKENSNNK